MEFFGNALIVLGALGLFLGYFSALCLAARKSVVHAFACVLVPMLLFYFLTTNLKQTWRTLLLLGCSLAVILVGVNLLKE